MALPTTAQGNVDLDRLKLPDGVSISKINGPVPERKYFPCKSGPETGGPQIVQSNPWSSQAGNMYPGPPAQLPPQAPGQFGNMFGGPPAKDPNVIVVDTNSLDNEKGKSKKKKNKKSENNGLPSPMSQPGGMFAPAPVQAPVPAPAPTGGKPREWTPAQYGGYVPPADGKGGGQVLIKSVNGKVVITPVPGTGANPPAPAPPAPATPAAPVKQSQAPIPAKKTNGAAPAGHEKSNGAAVLNGNNNNLTKVKVWISQNNKLDLVFHFRVQSRS